MDEAESLCVNPNQRLWWLGGGGVGWEGALKEMDCLLIVVISDQNMTGSMTTLMPY